VSALAVGGIGLATWAGGQSLPSLTPAPGATVPASLSAANTIAALLSLLALIGFANRYVKLGEDLDRWLALGSTLLLAAALHFLFTPLVQTGGVSEGDFIDVLAYGVLLIGVWQAIRQSEFGRAVAEERARVAREIHDGLAQYLFAVTTHTSMLEA
jgi:hypothetical protein